MFTSEPPREIRSTTPCSPGRGAPRGERTIRDELLNDPPGPDGELARRRLAFLLKASSELSASLSQDAILSTLNRLVVPALADWNIVFLVDEEGGVVRHSETHVDGAKRSAVETVGVDELGRLPGFAELLRDGEPIYVPEVDHDMLCWFIREVENQDAVFDLELRSFMAVPLSVRGRIIGGLGLGRTRDRHFDATDLALAQELGRRAALALDNARLFTDVQNAGHRLRTLVQGLDTVVWEADPNPLRFTFANQKAEELLGYPLGRWTGEAGFWERIVHPDDRIRTMDAFRRAATDRTDQDVDHRVMAADGRTVWLRTLIHPSSLADGEDPILRGLMLDVTAAKQREQRQEAEHVTARVLAEASGLTEATPELLGGICRALDWDAAELWIVDPTDDMLRLIEIWSDPEVDISGFEEVSRRTRLPTNRGLPGRVWGSAEPIWIRDVTEDPGFLRASSAARHGLHTAFGVPVLVGGRVNGVMAFYSRQTIDPDDELLQTMAVVGFQVGQFVQRRWVEEELRFQKVLLESQSEASIDGILVVGDEGRILYWNRRFAEMWSIPIELLEEGLSDAEAVDYVLEAVSDPDEFVDRIRHLYRHPTEHSRDELSLRDGRIFDRWSAPLRSGDGTHYGRAWYFRDVTQERTTEHILRVSQDRYAFLAEANALLTRSLDLETTLDRVARLAVPELADLCLVDLVEADGTISRRASATSDGRLTELADDIWERCPPEPAHPSGVAGVLRTGDSELYPALSAADPFPFSDPGRQLIPGAGIASAMFVPLVARDRILGAMVFLSSRHDRHYGEDDLRLAEQLAQNAAFAVDNARVYEERTEVARTLQQSFLPPSLPTITGADVAARFHPAGTGTEVGGDFYDLFQVGRDTWALALGDVSGKGAEAATITALARYTVRTAVLESQKPARVLSVLNEAIMRHQATDRFCSAVFGIVEPRPQRLRITLSCGGHPLPFVVRDNGKVEKVGKPGTILGVLPDPELSEVTVDLAPGETIVFYTDGVTEGRGPTTVFGEGMLSALLGWCAGPDTTAASVAQQVEKTVVDFQKGVPSDDIAILVLKAPRPRDR